MLERILLFPYWLTLKIRHSLYDRGILKSYPCEVPTICVGNITAGGTGKTPHTEMILDALLGSDEWGFKNLAVLSRGHKRKSRGFQQVTRDGSARFCGDEPLQIKRRYPSVTVAVDRPRVEGCRFLCHPDLLKTDKKGAGCRDKEIQPADLIILDDAFQYRRLRAWMNIVLVDWNRPLTKDRLLPFGRLRDLPERINKADIVIVSKCPAYMENWEKSGWVRSLGIEGFDPETCTGTNAEGRKVKVFFTCIRYRELEPVYAGEADSRFVYSKKLILFSGIAKDTPLRMYLSDKYKLVKRFTFSDHHNYTRMDIRRIMGAASSHPTAVVVCTEKDSQRVLDNKSVPGELKNRLFQIPIKVAFLTEEEGAIFSETLQNSLREFHSESAQTPRG
jgi:tetraacyldisaccharide 4'-kinase